MAMLGAASGGGTPGTTTLQGTAPGGAPGGAWPPGMLPTVGVTCGAGPGPGTPQPAAAGTDLTTMMTTAMTSAFAQFGNAAIEALGKLARGSWSRPTPTAATSGTDDTLENRVKISLAEALAPRRARSRSPAARAETARRSAGGTTHDDLMDRVRYLEGRLSRAEACAEARMQDIVDRVLEGAISADGAQRRAASGRGTKSAGRAATASTSTTIEDDDDGRMDAEEFVTPPGSPRDERRRTTERRKGEEVLPTAGASPASDAVQDDTKTSRADTRGEEPIKPGLPGTISVEFHRDFMKWMDASGNIREAMDFGSWVKATGKRWSAAEWRKRATSRGCKDLPTSRDGIVTAAVLRFLEGRPELGDRS